MGLEMAVEQGRGGEAAITGDPGERPFGGMQAALRFLHPQVVEVLEHRLSRVLLKKPREVFGAQLHAPRDVGERKTFMTIFLEKLLNVGDRRGSAFDRETARSRGCFGRGEKTAEHGEAKAADFPRSGRRRVFHLHQNRAQQAVVVAKHRAREVVIAFELVPQRLGELRRGRAWRAFGRDVRRGCARPYKTES